jgi:N-dimethylarginine dimethylaminohydrolase
MIRILVDPSQFEVLPQQLGENPYIRGRLAHHEKKTHAQHRALTKAIQHSPIVVETLPDTKEELSDIVFVANGGLALPRLGRPLVLLPHMKYAHRRAELPHLAHLFQCQGIPTVPYPGKQPFEGQAELKWFHGGRKAIGGYGYRATKQAFAELDAFFRALYGAKNAPEVLTVKLLSPTYYHLDIAMLEFDDTKCVVHRRAVSAKDLARIQEFLGAENVTVIDTNDDFCLNAVVDGPVVITHRLTDPSVKPLLERVTKRRVKQVDVSEFEKSGGSVRCMVFDLHV